LLVQNKEKSYRVLVDGAPGVGKSTLCRKISKDWGCEGFLSEYKLVVLLHLRERRIAKAMGIEDFFYHDDPELQAEVVRQVKKTSGAGVLLIFDGFDELSEEERMDRSLFLDVIKGEVLSQCSVLVTSRPYASESLQCLHSVCHVEVLGFTTWEIYESIARTIKDETNYKTVCTALEKREDIRSLCYIPLNCAILLYISQQQNYVLPDTLTELFELFILHALKRHAKLQNAHSVARKIHTLTSLPPPLNTDLDHLCKLAFNGLVEDRMVFHHEEIEAAVCMVGGEMETKLLGLMTAFKSFSSIGDDMTYQFLHLTIQEFLAARWVATHMPPQKQAQFFKDRLSEDRFQMVLVFLSGITKLNDLSFGVVFSVELNFLIPEEEDDMITTEKLFFRLVHFLYESQNTTHCHTLACAIFEQTIVLDMCSAIKRDRIQFETPALKFSKSEPYTRTLLGSTLRFQFMTFAYFIIRSSCIWKRLDIGDHALQSELCTIFFAQIEKECPSIGMQQLIISTKRWGSRRAVTFETVARISRMLAFKHLEVLEVVFSDDSNYFDPETDTSTSSSDLESFQCLMKNKVLKELALCNVLGVNDIVIKECLAPELAKTTTLKVLDITSSAISNSGFCSLFHALKHNKSVETLHVKMRMCGDLRELGLAIESALKTNRTLKVLSYKAHRCRYEGLMHEEADTVQSGIVEEALYCQELYFRLFGALASDNSTLKVLTIADHKFVMDEFSEIAVSLVGMLHNNKSLTSLNLTAKFLSLNALARGLAHNTSLTRLCMNSNEAELSLLDLAHAVCQNLSLKALVLDVWPRRLGILNFMYFLNILKLNRSLTSISVFCDITEDQLKVIARSLVLNGHRAEIELEFGQSRFYDSEYDLESYRNFRSRYESIIQEEVNKYKTELLTTMCSVYHVYQHYKREQFVAMVHFVHHVHEIYHRPL